MGLLRYQQVHPSRYVLKKLSALFEDNVCNSSLALVLLAFMYVVSPSYLLSPGSSGH